MLLPWAEALDEADETFRPLLTDERIRYIVSLIPEVWLEWEAGSAEANRKVYEQFLINRVAHSRNFVNEAKHARKVFI